MKKLIILLSFILLNTMNIKAMETDHETMQKTSGTVSIKPSEPTDLQSILTRLNLMSSEMNSLREENRSLHQKIEKLINPPPFSMMLFHEAPENWTPCPSTPTKAMVFGRRTLNGETVHGSFSEIIIPEDGIYEITGFSRWQTTIAYPFAGIAIDTIEGEDRQTSGSNENPHQWKLTSYNVTKKLKQNQKVMLIYRSPDNTTNWLLPNWRLKVERLF